MFQEAFEMEWASNRWSEIKLNFMILKVLSIINKRISVKLYLCNSLVQRMARCARRRSIQVWTISREIISRVGLGVYPFVFWITVLGVYPFVFWLTVLGVYQFVFWLTVLGMYQFVFWLTVLGVYQFLFWLTVLGVYPFVFWLTVLGVYQFVFWLTVLVLSFY